ncbi:MAG: hypothetical protein ACE5HR_08520 [bacterium]
MKATEPLHPEQRHPSKAYLVNELRMVAFIWREHVYHGATPTTQKLLRISSFLFIK